MRLFATPVAGAVVAVLWLITAIAGPGSTFARTQAAPTPPAKPPTPAPRLVKPPPGLALTLTSPIVDVGSRGVFTVSATSWPAPATVTLTFLSAHHGFTGPMVWVNNCACFRLAVYVARRVHPLETATAKAIVKTKAGIAVTSQTFQIRGLAPNGKDFSPGGTPALSAWVSLPRPADGDEQHYCAWLKTVDNLGVPGIRVKFVVHFLEGNQQWTSAPTGPSGIVCTQRSVGNAVPDYKVPVDVYAAGQHVRVSFTPRAAQ